MYVNLATLLQFLLFVNVSGCLLARGKCLADEKEEWSYDRNGTNGPDFWSKRFPYCHGKAQSPVNINTQSVVVDETLGKLEMNNYDTAVSKGTIENTGKTVKLTPGDGVSRTIVVNNSTYALEQLHFHWGEDTGNGSEHTLDDQQYAMEAHLVHKTKDGKIAVVGFFLEQSSMLPGMKPIIDALTSIQYKGTSTSLTSKLNLTLLVPENPASFYRYEGSLTTPGCDEGVSWTLLKGIATIGDNQILEFRNLYSSTESDEKSGCKIRNNYRPLQPLNNRKITSNQG